MRDVILVQGFGCSGSSVLIDFFNEIDSCYAFEKEFDLLRFSGGLFELEKLLPLNQLTISDSILKRYLNFVSYLHFPPDIGYGRNFKKLIGEDFLKISLEFFEKLVDFKIDIGFKIWNLHEYNYCKANFLDFFNLPAKKHFRHKLAVLLLSLAVKIAKKPYKPDEDIPIKVKTDNDNYCYYTKNLTQDEFIDIAREYLDNVLNLFPKSDYIVLDQPLNFKDKNIDHQLKYFDNAKVIFMPRDPRDTFLSFIKPSRKWLSENNVDEFINIYKWRYNAYPIKHDSVKNIYFEDFVLRYEDVAQNLLEFSEVDAELPKSFDIKKSRKNVGKWKNYKDQDVMDKIKHELNEYCWEN